MSDKRTELQNTEKRLLSEIEGQSEILEKKAENIVKTSLIVGASILAFYTLYNLLSDDSKPSKKKKKASNNRSGILNNPMVKNLMQSAVKKGIEMIVADKIKTK